MRKKTHEEYAAELKEKNPNVEVIGQYVNSKTKITHHCLVHDVHWEAQPLNVLNGSGCPKCHVERYRQTKQKPHEQYVKELNEVNPDIEVVEEYITSRTKILHHCKKHDVYWKIAPTNTLKGVGCSLCGSDKIRGKLSKTHEQYIKEVQKINPNIIVLGKYINANTPILHKCKSDGYEWMASPANILCGKGCPKCAMNIPYTTEEFIQVVHDINPNIAVLGEYVNANTKILFKCLIDGYEWETIPYVVLMGCGCPMCGNKKIGEKLRLSKDEIISRVECRGGQILNLNDYLNGSEENLKIVCPSCHNVFITSLFKYQRGMGHLCPDCFQKESYGENNIRVWLAKHNVKFYREHVFNECIDIHKLLFDFYLPEYNMCIEYQGRQHYEPVEYFGGEAQFQLQQKHDQIKRNYCKDHNIRLLEIPYWEDIEESLSKILFI